MRFPVLYISILLAGLLCSMGTMAQEPMSLEQKTTSVNAIYSTFEKYMRLKEMSEVGVEGISIDEAVKLKPLFTDDAVIYDDITPVKFPGVYLDDWMMLATREKTFDELMMDYVNHFPSGIRIATLRASIDLTQLANRTASITVVRNISGKYDGDYFLSNKRSTLQMVFTLSEDYSTARIRKVKNVGASIIEFTGELPEAIAMAEPKKPKKEKPAKQSKEKPEKPIKEKKPKPVKEKPAKPPKEKPVKEVKEKPPKPVKEKPVKPPKEKREKPTIGLDLVLNIGQSLNSGKVKEPDLSVLAYESLIADSLFGFNASKGLGYSTSIDVGLDMVMGKKRRMVLGVRFHYGYHQFAYQAEKMHLRYAATNVGNEPTGTFLRLYTANDITEKLRLTNYGLTLMLRYQVVHEKKVGFYINGGGNFALSNSNVSKYAVGSTLHEAVYQFRDGQYDFDPTGSIEPADWLITEQALVQSGSELTTAAYFEQMSPFGVAFTNDLSGKSEKVSFGLVYGVSFGAGMVIPMSPSMDLRLGLQVNYTSLGSNGFNEKLTEGEEIGTRYNSTFYVVDGATIIDYGLNIGISYKLLR